jgi:hypothetical protein
MLNLKIELINELALVRTLKSVNRRLDLLAERMSVLRKVDGEESRLMGFLHFKQHNLLVGKLLATQKTGTEAEFEEMTLAMGPMVSETLTQAVRLLGKDIGCPPEMRHIVSLSQNEDET